MASKSLRNNRVVFAEHRRHLVDELHRLLGLDPHYPGKDSGLGDAIRAHIQCVIGRGLSSVQLASLVEVIRAAKLHATKGGSER